MPLMFDYREVVLYFDIRYADYELLTLTARNQILNGPDLDPDYKKHTNMSTYIRIYSSQTTQAYATVKHAPL
jgi:hypothetical protein